MQRDTLYVAGAKTFQGAVYLGQLYRIPHIIRIDHDLVDGEIYIGLSFQYAAFHFFRFRCTVKDTGKDYRLRYINTGQREIGNILRAVTASANILFQDQFGSIHP